MILDLGSISQLVHMTGQCSNAVLLAILPQISDVSQKLSLPIPLPITSGHISQAAILARRDITVFLRLTNGWTFSFRNGYVNRIGSQDAYFGLQDPDQIPAFYGQVRISREEAIEMARGTPRKLGIPLESVFADQEPRVTFPPKIGNKVVPRYRIEWLDPRAGAHAADFEINGDANRVERIYLLSKSLEKTVPELDVLMPRNSGPTINPKYAEQLIPIVLHAISRYAQALSLPISPRLTTNNVARFSITDNGGWPHCEVELTSRWRFIYRNSMVNAYYAPDNLFNSDSRPIRIKDFIGQWNMTEDQAITLIRRTLTKLNCPTNLVLMDFKPRVSKPALPGIPRYSIYWWAENETHDDLKCKIEAEIDADKGELKSLYYDHVAYWNQPPRIDVPLSLPRPSATGVAPLKPSPRTPAVPRTRLRRK